MATQLCNKNGMDGQNDGKMEGLEGLGKHLMPMLPTVQQLYKINVLDPLFNEVS